MTVTQELESTQPHLDPGLLQREPETEHGQPVFSVRELDAFYGRSAAIRGVNLDIPEHR